MRILILTVQYHPVANPNVYRWAAISEYWVQQGHEVYVLCSKRFGSPEEEKINGVNVHRTGQATLLDFIYNIFKVKKRRGTTGEKSNQQQHSARKVLEKVVDWTWRKIYWPDGSCLWYFPTRKKAKKILQQKSFDVVISVGLPFTAHLIGMFCKNKNPKLKWLMDIEDPFCYSEAFFVNNFHLYRRLNYNKERSTFQTADRISVTVEQAKQKYTEMFPEFTEKITVIGPLFNLDFSKIPKKNDLFSSGKIHLSYFGTFYENVRSPHSFLQILKQCLHLHPELNDEIRIHIFGELDVKAMAIFEEYPELKSIILFHGLIDRASVSAAILQTDFLINIGNTTDYHLPSKSVDYLMSGKPIINICQNSNDTFKALLKDYPLILNLESHKKSNEVSARQFITFIQSENGKQVSRHQIDSLGKPFQLNEISGKYLQLIQKKFNSKTYSF